MSVDLYALCPTDLPDKSAWHAAISEQHFPLAMSKDFDPTKDSGFWPAKLDGHDTGFEYYPLLKSEWERLPNLTQPSRFKSGINLTHSELSEFVASIMGVVSIARACGGVAYDPQESKVYQGLGMDQLLMQAELAQKVGGSPPPRRR